MSTSPRGGGGGKAVASGQRAAGLGRRRTGESSSPGLTSADAIWPLHFVEDVAVRVAIDAAGSAGRLAAAPAVVAVFQVCSTWRAASHSELLWKDLTHRVWSIRPSSPPSWHDEFVRLHRTAANFRARRSAYSHLLPPSAAALSCCRLTLSHHHLAAGFLDGSVCLFDLPAGSPVATYRPDPHRDRLGRFSQAISGILLLLSQRLVFASLNGDVHVVSLGISCPIRQARVGNLLEDGALVDFAGDARWWVGLFAGVPGQSWHVWDATTEQLSYVGGTLTDSDAVLGWYMLTNLPGPVAGRVRIAEPGVAVGCTASSIEVLYLNVTGPILSRLELQQEAAVVDACEGRVMVVDSRGLAKVYWVSTLQEVCRFITRRGEEEQQQQAVGVQGCMNWGYAVVWSAGGVRLWDATTGEYLYCFRERIGNADVMAASDRYVVAWANDTGLHLWDFGAL